MVKEFQVGDLVFCDCKSKCGLKGVIVNLTLNETAKIRLTTAMPLFTAEIGLKNLKYVSKLEKALQ